MQAALPRLLSAAAPPGIDARDNRRKCLKVLFLFTRSKSTLYFSLAGFSDLLAFFLGSEVVA